MQKNFLDMFVYVVLENKHFESLQGIRYSSHVLGVFSTLEKAKKHFDSLPNSDECEISVEEWPLDEIKTRFNTRVVGDSK